MLWTLVALSALGATPEYSVVVARRIGVDAKRSAELSGELARALEKQSSHPLGNLVSVTDTAARLAKAGFPDPATCSGAAACVANLVRVSGLARLVSLQLVKVGGELAIDASIIEGETGRSLVAVTRTANLKNPGAELEALAAELIRKLPVPQPLAAAALPSDAPAEVRLTPQDASQPPLLAASPGLAGGQKLALGLGAGALVALAVGVGMGASAMGQSSALTPRDPLLAEKQAAAR
ncbi:MAG: hypothetical protein ACYC8T_24605, partial [Myxococcaceae bacterium]